MEHPQEVPAAVLFDDLADDILAWITAVTALSNTRIQGEGIAASAP